MINANRNQMDERFQYIKYGKFINMRQIKRIELEDQNRTMASITYLELCVLPQLANQFISTRPIGLLKPILSSFLLTFYDLQLDIQLSKASNLAQFQSIIPSLINKQPILLKLIMLVRKIVIHAMNAFASIHTLILPFDCLLQNKHILLLTHAIHSIVKESQEAQDKNYLLCLLHLIDINLRLSPLPPADKVVYNLTASLWQQPDQQYQSFESLLSTITTHPQFIIQCKHMIHIQKFVFTPPNPKQGQRIVEEQHYIQLVRQPTLHSPIKQNKMYRNELLDDCATVAVKMTLLNNMLRTLVTNIDNVPYKELQRIGAMTQVLLNQDDIQIKSNAYCNILTIGVLQHYLYSTNAQQTTSLIDFFSSTALKFNQINDYHQCNQQNILFFILSLSLFRTARSFQYLPQFTNPQLKTIIYLSINDSESLKQATQMQQISSLPSTIIPMLPLTLLRHTATSLLRTKSYPFLPQMPPSFPHAAQLNKLQIEGNNYLRRSISGSSVQERKCTPTEQAVVRAYIKKITPTPVIEFLTMWPCATASAYTLLHQNIHQYMRTKDQNNISNILFLVECIYLFKLGEEGLEAAWESIVWSSYLEGQMQEKCMREREEVIRLGNYQWGDVFQRHLKYIKRVDVLEMLYQVVENNDKSRDLKKLSIRWCELEENNQWFSEEKAMKQTHLAILAYLRTKYIYQ